MNAEFFSAIADIEKEKGIPQSYMLEKIEQALLAALKKDYPAAQECARVVLDPEMKTVNMFLQKEVAEPVEDPDNQISLEEAKKTSPTIQVGDFFHVPVDAKKFGRIAAQAAKQVIIQGIREAERGLIYDEFTSKEHEILSGVITRVDPRTGGVSIQINSNSEFTEAYLSPSERIPNESLREGDRIKVYVVEVRKLSRGPQVLISRTHPDLSSVYSSWKCRRFLTVPWRLRALPGSRQPHEDCRLVHRSGCGPHRRLRRTKGRTRLRHCG